MTSRQGGAKKSNDLYFQFRIKRRARHRKKNIIGANQFQGVNKGLIVV